MKRVSLVSHSTHRPTNQTTWREHEVRFFHVSESFTTERFFLNSRSTCFQVDSRRLHLIRSFIFNLLQLYRRRQTSKTGDVL